MSKSLYIAEKPSVAQEFAKALHLDFSRKDGYLEATEAVVTWCVGHLVTMSYPEAYDEKYKRWSLTTLPFLPKEWKYEVISSVKKQFQIVSSLLNRPDVTCIYVCTDSGREGEYIYRLVEQMAGVKNKERRRVWIDSQTEEEILRGIREANERTCLTDLLCCRFLPCHCACRFCLVCQYNFYLSRKLRLIADFNIITLRHFYAADRLFAL